MNLSITTPQGRLFNGEVQSVVLPGVLGSFQVLANHAPTLSSLTAGRIIYTIEGKKNFVSVQSGLVSVSDNQIMVVCKPIEKQQ